MHLHGKPGHPHGMFKGFYVTKHTKMSETSCSVKTTGYSAYMWAKGNRKVEFEARTMSELRALILTWWEANHTPGKSF
jgi:hypothetical protein